MTEAGRVSDKGEDDDSENSESDEDEGIPDIGEWADWPPPAKYPWLLVPHSFLKLIPSQPVGVFARRQMWRWM